MWHELLTRKKQRLLRVVDDNKTLALELEQFRFTKRPQNNFRIQGLQDQHYFDQITGTFSGHMKWVLEYILRSILSTSTHLV